MFLLAFFSSFPLHAATCEAIALNDPSLPLFKALQTFHKAFETHENEYFLKVLNPALVRKESIKQKIFPDLLMRHPFSKQTPGISSIYRIKSTHLQDRFVDCNGIQIQGVVGPVEQYAVVHQLHLKKDTYRIFTLWADINEELKKINSYEEEYGIIHMFTGKWSYQGKNPYALIRNAQRIDAKNDFFSAYFLYDLSFKILNDNKYYLEKENFEAQKWLEENPLSGKLEKIQKEFQKDWKLRDISTGFHEDGVGPLFKFEMPDDEDEIFRISQKCVEYSLHLYKIMNFTREPFAGIHCQAFFPQENISKPPRAGGKWITWEELLEFEKKSLKK